VLWTGGVVPTSGMRSVWENALKTAGHANWLRSVAMAYVSQGRTAVPARGIVPASQVSGATRMPAKRANVRRNVMA
jgi:hypothetical protein